MRKASGNMESVYQTEAQWTADERVFTADVVAITTDGSNIGKHKLMDGVHRWSALSYVEASTGGGASVYLDGVAQDGTYVIEAVSNGSGVISIDFSAATPPLASVKVISYFIPDDPSGFFYVYDGGLSGLVKTYSVQNRNTASPEAGVAVIFTAVGIEA